MINVDRRDWMIAMREKLEMTREGMAKLCKCSCLLLEMIEEHGAITQPNIAARIARKYGMDVKGYNSLAQEDRTARVIPKWQEPPSKLEFSWYTIGDAGAEAL